MLSFTMEVQKQQEVRIFPDSDTPITENEIAGVRQAILEAEYFDAKSMAPLTPASVVSISFALYEVLPRNLSNRTQRQQ